MIVEEPSMEVALQVVLPKLLQRADFEIRRFQCKDDLLKNLPHRLRAYAKWLPENWAILVLVDQDDDDCNALKGKLEAISREAGLLTKNAVCEGVRFQVANRIAVEELEAWFFGDWEAVQAPYPKVPATIPHKAAYRDPDAIRGGTWEALERVFKKAGYFGTGLRKVECARAVAQHMKPDRNRSQSFQAFRAAVEAAERRD